MRSEPRAGDHRADLAYVLVAIIALELGVVVALGATLAQPNLPRCYLF